MYFTTATSHNHSGVRRLWHLLPCERFIGSRRFHLIFYRASLHIHHIKRLRACAGKSWHVHGAVVSLAVHQFLLRRLGTSSRAPLVPFGFRASHFQNLKKTRCAHAKCLLLEHLNPSFAQPNSTELTGLDVHCKSRNQRAPQNRTLWSIKLRERQRRTVVMSQLAGLTSPSHGALTIELEDLQWADSDTIHLLQSLIDDPNARTSASC